MRKVSRAVCQQACSEVVSWCNVSAGLFTCVVADAARNQLTNFLVAEKARRLLGPSVAMRFADIILPDIYFFTPTRRMELLSRRRQMLYYIAIGIGSRLAEKRKKAKREREAIRLSSSRVDSQVPTVTSAAISLRRCLYFFHPLNLCCGVTQHHTHVPTCAQEERSGFHLTDSQPARVSCSKQASKSFHGAVFRFLINFPAPKRESDGHNHRTTLTLLDPRIQSLIGACMVSKKVLQFSSNSLQVSRHAYVIWCGSKKVFTDLFKGLFSCF